jgi:hypothetical protein
LSRFRGTFHSFDPVGFAFFAILGPANSPQAMVKGLGLHRSAVVGRIFLQQENWRRAIWDFCDNICHKRTHAVRHIASVFDDPIAAFGGNILTAQKRPRYRIVHHSYALGRRRRATVTNLQQEQFFRLSPQPRRLANPANVIDRWCGLKPST